MNETIDQQLRLAVALLRLFRYFILFIARGIHDFHAAGPEGRIKSASRPKQQREDEAQAKASQEKGFRRSGAKPEAYPLYHEAT
jgi:hypothetical protein